MRIEKALYENGSKRLYLVNDQYDLVEEALLFTNFLYSKGYSLNTIQTYLYDLKLFFEYLQFKSLDYKAIRPIHISQYQDYLVGHGDGNTINLEVVPKRSPETVNRKLAAVASFYKYHERVMKTLTSPFLKGFVRRPEGMYKSRLHHLGGNSRVEKSLFTMKIRKKLLKRLFPEEYNAFYASMESFRDKVIFKLLLMTGCRIGELLGLRVEDYSEPYSEEELGEIYVVIRGDNRADQQQKTGERVVHVPMDLILEIDEYVIQHRPYVEGVDHLFVANKGRYKGQSLTRGAVEKVFREVSKKTGIRCNPHMLRHTHLTELTEFGYDPKYLIARSGHASINSAQPYIHLSVKHQREAYNRYLRLKRGEHK